MLREFVSDKEILDVVKSLGEWNASQASKQLDITRRAVSARFKKITGYLENGEYPEYEDLLKLPRQQQFGTKAPSVKIREPEQPGLPIEELIDHRIKRFEQKGKHEKSRKLVPVKISHSEPLGLFFFGDPHVDDDGCDLKTLRSHSELIRDTDELYAVNIGDTTNNWIGRLSRLYQEQATTREDALRIAEWFIQLVGKKWFVGIGGNHDGWSGADDPIRWMMKKEKAFYTDSEIRMNLQFKNKASVIVHMAHDFKGFSQYTPEHGARREAYFGFRDDVTVNGHKHTSAYSNMLSPDESKTMHFNQVASYKIYDRYQREGGFKNKHISPCGVFVIDPNGDPITNRVMHFHDPFYAADYLKFLRRKK